MTNLEIIKHYLLAMSPEILMRKEGVWLKELIEEVERLRKLLEMSREEKCMNRLRGPGV